MQPLFDLRALSVLSLASSLMLVAAMLLSRRVDRDSRSIDSWISGSAQVAAGFLLIGLRGLLPDLLSIVLANLLIASGFSWIYFAARLTLGLPRGPRWDLASGLAVAASAAHFTYLVPDLAARIIVISAVIAALGFAGARVLLLSAAARRDPDRGAVAAMGVAALALALVNALRALLAFLDPPSGDFLALTGAIHRAAFLVNLLFSLTLVFALAYLFSMRAQRRLRASEARFEATFDQAAVGIGLFDIDGRWLRANRRLCEILGYREAELQALRFHDITHPDDLKESEADRARMVAGTSATVTREKRYLRKDGSPVWVRRSTTLVRDADGAPDHFVSAIDDIQARKDAEDRLRAAQEAAIADADRSRRAALNLMEDALAARQRAEATATHLKESEERLRLLIEHAPAALAMFDRDMRYLAASQRWRDDYRLGERELVGQPHYTLFPELGEELKAIHRRGLAGEVMSSQEDRFARADGRLHWLRWEMRPWRQADGDVGGIVIFSEDITARRLAEDALRASELRFHDIVRASADWIWEVDAEARYTYASDTVVDMLGYTPAEVIGRTPFDFMPADEARRLRDEFAAIAARKEAFRDLDNVNLRKDGQLRHVSTNGMPILAADGSLLGYRGLDRDITERKQAEANLRMLADDMEATLQAIPDLLFEIDAGGRYLAVKASQESLLAAPPAQLLGRTVAQVLPPEAAGTVMAALEAAARNAVDYGKTIMLPLEDGPRYFEISVARKPVEQGKVDRFIVLSRDISVRKAAEAELQARNEELERFNRATVGRELDMIALKGRINALAAELGREPPYPLAFLQDEDRKVKQ